jgi:group I intron endonuclease
MKNCGIYSIVNKINKKIYIGSSIDIKKRWRDHKWYLRHNIHHNNHLQCAWNKYGSDCFEFSIILECSVSDLINNEIKYINIYNSNNKKLGYNKSDPEHKTFSWQHSEETKQILSQQKLGEKNPMWGLKGNKHHNYQKEISIDVRKKMSLSHLGIPTNRRNNAKLSMELANEIRNIYNTEKITIRNLGKRFNVSYTTVNRIIHNISWKA